MKLGIVGLPNVGKSTLFNAITNAGAQSANYPFCTIEPNVGVVAVPDKRLEVLAEIYHSQKILPAAIELSLIHISISHFFIIKSVAVQCFLGGIKTNTALYVDDIIIFKATHHMYNRVYFANIGQKFVTQAFSFGSASHQTCNIHKFNSSR